MEQANTNAEWAGGSLMNYSNNHYGTYYDIQHT